MSDVAEFFDRQSEDYYRAGDSGFRRLHAITARRLEAALSGRVLSVGGVWFEADLDACDLELTVADISAAMLQPWADRGLNTVRCDARELPFVDGSFDHLVLPLVLHHVNDGSARSARAGVRRALGQACRVLREGGVVWISEFSLPTPVYGMELAVAPATRLVLSLANIPLVMMHTAGFYSKVLGEAGFEPTVHRIESKHTRASDWMTPVIGLPWLKVPRLLYPLRTVLIEAAKRRSGTR